MDRYVSSSQIHQGGKISDAEEKKKFLDFLEKMEFDVFKIPKPDAIIFLNVPYEISKKLVEKKSRRAYVGTDKKDKVEISRAYQEGAYRQSLDLVRKYNNWIEISCTEKGVLLASLAISDKIWAALEKMQILNKKK